MSEIKEPERRFKVGDRVVVTYNKMNAAGVITKLDVCGRTVHEVMVDSVSLGGFDLKNAMTNVCEEYLSTPTPDIRLNGYKVAFHDDYIEVGCVRVDIETARTILRAMERK